MAHAEKCPICNGNGRIDNYKGTVCRGCDGKGWVEVSDPMPAGYWPCPSPNGIPAGTVYTWMDTHGSLVKN